MKIVNKKYKLSYINTTNNIVGTEYNTMYYYTPRNSSLLSMDMRLIIQRTEIPLKISFTEKIKRNLTDRPIIKIIYKTTIKDNGIWDAYKNGRKIKRYPADAMPGSLGFKY